MSVSTQVMLANVCPVPFYIYIHVTVSRQIKGLRFSDSKLILQIPQLADPLRPESHCLIAP